MPHVQLKKESDLEKRLKILSQQLYGKTQEQKLEVRNEKLEMEVGGVKSHITPQHPISHLSHPTSNLTTDVAYLKHDLTKIALLSSVVMGFQLILYFSQTLSKVKLF